MNRKFIFPWQVAVSVIAALLSAGGNGCVAATPTPTPTPTPAAAFGFNSTASLKTTHTVLYNGKGYGMARAGFQGLVDQCNGFRQLYYQLGAVSPSEETMASLDVLVQEKYIAADKALTLVMGKGLVLTDAKRWQDQLAPAAAAGGYPPVPPDCSVSHVTETRKGTLWRDGLVYDLRFETRKAIGRRTTAVPLTYMSNAQFASFALSNVAGQTCREIVGVIDLSLDSQACVWDIFPYVRYLNWPFALRGHVQFGPNAILFETIVSQAAEHGKALPPATFEIPPGFTVTVLN